ncbi:hypothetical protein, partial [Salmonella enterica]|uniref:hypothetical protein n=1 Tax=Salmonella enterica TaxID=28901 RepID=UPI000AB8FF60
MGTGMAVDMALRTPEITYIWAQAGEEQGARVKEKGAGEGESGRGGLRGFAPGTICGGNAPGFFHAGFLGEKSGGGGGVWGAFV